MQITIDFEGKLDMRFSKVIIKNDSCVGGEPWNPYKISEIHFDMF
jgi:hypothetical protein